MRRWREKTRRVREPEASAGANEEGLEHHPLDLIQVKDDGSRSRPLMPPIDHLQGIPVHEGRSERPSFLASAASPEKRALLILTKPGRLVGEGRRQPRPLAERFC